MDPPPIPMLWGLTNAVHRRAAMAPSTAEPPCWSMFLEISWQDLWEVYERTHHIFATKAHVKTFLIDASVWTLAVYLFFQGVRVWRRCQETSLNHVLMLEQHTRKLLAMVVLFFFFWTWLHLELTAFLRNYNCFVIIRCIQPDYTARQKLKV